MHRTACAPANTERGCGAMCMPGRVQRRGGLCPGRAAAGRRRLPRRHAGSMQRPTPQRWGARTSDTGGARAPRTSCHSVRSLAPSRPIFGVRRRRQRVRGVRRRQRAAGGRRRARSWESLDQGEIGMALRARRDGAVAISDGRHGGTALGDAGLPQARMGRDDPCIGGAGVAEVMAWRRWAMPSAERT